MIIYRDTKEKKGWDWMFQSAHQIEIMNKGLKTGDYTVEGYESDICVERKASTSEISLNLGQQIDRFRRELERMQAFRFRWVICEFSRDALYSFPVGSSLPRKMHNKVRARGPFLCSRVAKLEEEYQTEFLFFDDRERAEQHALDLIMEAVSVLKSER